MKTYLIGFLALTSMSSFASEKLCTTVFLNQEGMTTQHGYFKASLKECFKYANDVTKGMNASGSKSTLVVQHPDIGDSQILIRIESKQHFADLID